MRIDIVTLSFLLTVLSVQGQNSNSEIVTVVQSGDFNSMNTWKDGIRPTINSTIIVPSNLTIYINDPLNVNFKILSFQVYGKLQIGSPNDTERINSFRFNYSTNIMIFSGGMLEDLTTNHSWILPGNSIITIYGGGSFRSSGITTIYSSLSNSNKMINSTINGPFTLTIDLQERIETYSVISFSPVSSGDFGLNSTWLGGLSPTINRCSPTAGGCVLLIPDGINVTRRHNQSTINAVHVYIYGQFEILSWGKYSFLYPMTFHIYDRGIFKDSTEDGFRFNVNTSIIVYPGGTYLTQPTISYISYKDPNTILSTFRLNRTIIRGPYRLSITPDGLFDDNGTISMPTSTTTRSTTTKYTGATLRCYSCQDCSDPFKSNIASIIEVPANQGYFCRKSSVFGVVDRDAGNWCDQGQVGRDGIWCCQSNLCNSASRKRIFFQFILLLIFSFGKYFSN